MKELQPFFRAFWQVGVPILFVVHFFEYSKPGFVQSRLNLTVLFVIILVFWLIDHMVFTNDRNV